MKIEQISPHIWSLKSWMLIPLTVWVVVEEDGVTLVDAGMPFMAKGILKFIDNLNAGPLQRILLTHGHGDHVGSIKAILNSQRYGSVPIYAHRIEIPYMEGEVAYPKRKKPEHNLAKGIAQPLLEEENQQMQNVQGLKPYFTPGHSPGHVVYYHEEDQVLLTGDLFTSKKGRLYRPMPIFTPDMAEALRSSAIVKQLNPKRLEVCHGNAVLNPADHLEEYIQTTAAKYSISRDALNFGV